MKNKTKLSVFDFDNTLIATPLPDSGKIAYEEKTGKSWPHKGWWGQADSLDMNVFDIQPNPDVVSDFKKEKSSDTTLTVMLTGRLKKLSNFVKAILDKHNLTFDEYHFNNGGRTDEEKLKTLDELLDKYPSIKIVEQWDDRLSHIPKFEAWGKEKCMSGRLKDFKVNVVFNSEGGLY
jgi:HAD domain family 1 in Swiss Army Knife RNA repair proteins